VSTVDEIDFQRAAERDGFKVARTEMTPGRTTPERDHALDIRGMVLEGRFTVKIGGAATTYGPGEVFEVPAGSAHSERHDPQGGLLLVGRRQVRAEP
jgi:quercetin dioxygenase-like cupin family protein